MTITSAPHRRRRHGATTATRRCACGRCSTSGTLRAARARGHLRRAVAPGARSTARPSIAFATDATRMGGAMGIEGCRHIVDAIDTAVRERVPVHRAVALRRRPAAPRAWWRSTAVGQVFAAMVRASGRVPQISVVLGPAAGGAAYGPALTDIVIMSGGGRIFVTGPEVVRSVTGEQVDMERLGGPEPHGRRSGVVHVTTKDDASALAEARELAALLGRQGRLSPADVGRRRATWPRCCRPRPTGPTTSSRWSRRCSTSPGVELHAKWAPNIVTTLGRLRRAHGRRHRQQPAAAGRLPGRAPARRRRPGSCGCATRSACR